MSAAIQRSSYTDSSRLVTSHGKSRPGDENMNEMASNGDELTLSVVLPDRQVKEMNIKYHTPMMDLLVQVASSNRLKPGEHMISVISEETGRAMDYQPSQSIGSLATNRIFLISKSQQRKQRESEVQRQRDASKFEQTIRVTINMPKGVRSVQRLNPNLPLMDLYKRICVEKGVDASRYQLLLTKLPKVTVDMSLSLNDYKANEISIVPCKDSTDSTQAPEYHTSMVDISRVGNSRGATLAPSTNPPVKMAEPVEKMKKKGLFSFFKRDKNKKKLDEVRTVPVQALPKNGDVSMNRKPQAQVKPQRKVQPTIHEEAELDDVGRNKAKRAPSKKKTRAPAPPVRPQSMMAAISEEKNSTAYASSPSLLAASTTRASGKVNKAPLPNDKSTRQHSRNSSDSSGYHEPPVTPPGSASSPSTVDGSSLTRPKTSANVEPAKQKPRPASAVVQRSQTLPAQAAMPKKSGKKKAAPAPPVPAPSKPAASVTVEPPASLTLHDNLVESEDETTSLSSPTDDAPELGILSFNSKSTAPPIFIAPPPPQSPPPSLSAASPSRETVAPSSESPGEALSPERSQAPLHNRSESRCSRASVDTIDDVQQYFDLAIAAGEKQLRHEQVSPASPAGSVELSSPSTKAEVARLADEFTTLTTNLTKDTALTPTEDTQPAAQNVEETTTVMPPVEQEKTTSVTGAVEQEETTAVNCSLHGKEVMSAVAQLNMSVGEDEGSDASLVPDGENFVVAASKLPSGGQVKDADADAKPVEEISYGEVIRFDNPFRDAVPPVTLDEGQQEVTASLTRRDSDSTLPDSEHTDRPQSSSLQSSSLHSDEESVTEAGEGSEKVSQSEAETSTIDSTDSTSTVVETKAKRGMFMEMKGQDRDKAVYEKGSVRGIPGQVEDTQVKTRAASFTKDSPLARGRGPTQTRPKSVFSILSAQKVETDSKRLSLGAQTNVTASSTSKEPASSSALYSKPLPVYSRMNRADSSKEVTSPTTAGETRGLASVIADSMRSGEASKAMKKVPEANSKPMFFKAARSNPRMEAPPVEKIENVVKLDTSKYEVKAPQTDIVVGSQAEVKDKKTPPPTAAKPNKPGASVARKESLKEQYNKLQENMAKWQNKLKSNESRVKELTTSQQNLSTVGLSVNTQSADGEMTKSTSAAPSKPFANRTDEQNQSAPAELQKVTLRSAAQRVIAKAEPELDPVETLMKSIRDRGGRISDSAPDRGIYVSSGTSDPVTEAIASREVAPSLAPPAKSDAKVKVKVSNGVNKSTDPRFNPTPAPRDSLLAEIANAGGRPANRRRVPADSSSSPSSSDELKEIQVRHKAPRPHKHKNSKRSVSDPFPPQGPNSRNHIQPTPTELDPREELMIAIRNSGGLGRLRQVNADEIRWSANV